MSNGCVEPTTWSPAFHGSARRTSLDSDARVDGDTAVFARDNWVQVQFCHLREFCREAPQTMHEVDERGAVRRWGAAEASHEDPGLPFVDELLGIDVGERGRPDAGAADQLGEHAARPEGDERSEDGVLNDAGEELGSAFDLRLHDHRRADALDGRADGELVAEAERDAPAFRLVRTGH